MAVRVERHGGTELAGAVDPFEALFHAEYATVVGIANRVLSDSHEAEDVAQDVFVAFLRRHAPDAPYAAPWLRAAAAHAALNVVRGRRRRVQRETEHGHAHGRLYADGDSDADPQRALEAGEQRREVQAALARLPVKTAAVLVLRHSGLSYAEVAAALGVKPGDVGTLLRRGERALSQEMARQ